jgi:hypothetical protein
MFRKTEKPTQPVEGEALVEKLKSQVESFKGENQALKEKMGKMIDLSAYNWTENLKTLKELTLVAKIAAGLYDDSLVIETKTSFKQGGEMAIEIVNAKSKQIVAVAKVRGVEKRQKNSYWFDTKSVTLFIGNVEVKVPQVWMDLFDFEINQHISTWADKQSEQALKDLDKALKSA